MDIPKIPLNAALEVQVGIDRQSIIILALSLACVVAFGILLSRITKR